MIPLKPLSDQYNVKDIVVFLDLDLVLIFHNFSKFSCSRNAQVNCEEKPQLKSVFKIVNIYIDI